MISETDRAAIERAVAELGIETWRGLDVTEADLLRRALAPAPTTERKCAA